MRHDPKVVWECDRCGKSEETSGVGTPPGWRALFPVQPARRVDISGLQWYDICPGCEASFDRWWQDDLLDALEE